MTSITTLFAEYLSLSAVTRARRMDTLRASDPALAEQLAGLLAAHEQSGSLGASLWLQGDTDDATPEGSEPQLQVGETLGRYRVDALLGEGGMGSVYRGTRADGTLPLPVALKCARYRGGRGESLLHEASLMERLRHPGIAQFYDVLRIDAGHVAVVMEWVDGQTLEQRRLTGVEFMQALSWVIEAAAALAYAHDRQVLHGDIKPSNVMVDAAGQVKLIDFGIGVLLQSRTGPALACGITPGFAAPEIALDQEISTRSDIYSLGRLLLRVWGDSTSWPVDSGERHDEHLERVLRSLHWSKGLRSPDVRAVLRKTCAWSAAARYASAAAFRDDLIALRHSVKPNAVPWSTLQHLRHQVTTRPLQSSFAGLMLAALLGFTTILYRQGIQLNQSLDEARVAQTATERTLSFLLESLEAASSEAENTVDATVRDVAKAAYKNLALLKETDPETAARVAISLMKVDHGQERYASVIQTAEDYYRNDLTGQSQARLLLAKFEALRELGRLDEAESLLADSRWPSDFRKSWRFRQARARLLRTQRRAPEAEALTRITLAESPADLTEAERVNLPGEMVAYLGDQGKLDEALVFLDQQADAIQRFAPGSNAAGRNAQNRAILLMWVGKNQEALAALEVAEKIYRERLDPGHSSHADMLEIRTLLLIQLGETNDALQATRRAREIYIRQLGAQHGKVAESWHTEGNLHLTLGAADAALASYQKAVEIFNNAKLPGGGVTRYMICALLHAEGKNSEALPICEKSVEVLSGFVTDDSFQMANAKLNLGVVQIALGDHATGLRHAREGVAAAEAAYPEDSLDLATIFLSFSSALQSIDLYDEARSHFGRAAGIFESQQNSIPPLKLAMIDRVSLRVDPGWRTTSQGQALLRANMDRRP